MCTLKVSVAIYLHHVEFCVFLHDCIDPIKSCSEVIDWSRTILFVPFISFQIQDCSHFSMVFIALWTKYVLHNINCSVFHNIYAFIKIHRVWKTCLQLYRIKNKGKKKIQKSMSEFPSQISYTDTKMRLQLFNLDSSHAGHKCYNLYPHHARAPNAHLLGVWRSNLYSRQFERKETTLIWLNLS